MAHRMNAYQYKSESDVSETISIPSKTITTTLLPFDRNSLYSFSDEDSAGLSNSNNTSSASSSFLDDSLRDSGSFLITPIESTLNQPDLSISQNKIGRAIQALKKLQAIYGQNDLLENKLLILKTDALEIQKQLRVQVEALTTLLQDKKLTNEAVIMHNTNELIIESSYAIRDALTTQRIQLNQRFQDLQKKCYSEIWDLESPFEGEFLIGQETPNEPLAQFRQQLQTIEKLHQDFESNFIAWEIYLTNEMPPHHKVVDYNHIQWLDNLQRVFDESQENTLPNRLDEIFDKVIDLEFESGYLIHYQKILSETTDYEDSIIFIQHMQENIERIQQENKRGSGLKIQPLENAKNELIDNLSQYEKALYNIIQDLDGETLQPSEEKIESLKLNLNQTIKYTIQKMATCVSKDLFERIKPRIYSSYTQTSIHERISKPTPNISQTMGIQQRFKNFASSLRSALGDTSSKEEKNEHSTLKKNNPRNAR